MMKTTTTTALTLLMLAAAACAVSAGSPKVHYYERVTASPAHLRLQAAQMKQYAAFLEVQANAMQFGYDPSQQTRAAYNHRRRKTPYGGADISVNPFRPPNSPRSGNTFFTPKFKNSAVVGTSQGIGALQGIRSQEQLLNSGTMRMYGAQQQLHAGGPGPAHMTNQGRPYGVDPYQGPYSYYSPPPLPSTAAPAGASAAASASAEPAAES